MLRGSEAVQRVQTERMMKPCISNCDLIQREKGLKGQYGKIQSGMNSKQVSFSDSLLIELNNINLLLLP